MRIIWDWLVKNVPNIFSVIGIGLTIYFGYFYVPRSLRDAEKERIENAEQHIVQSIKELTFADTVTNYHEIGVLINADEIQINEKLPHSEIELLTSAEGSFMKDIYLPLNVRRKLIGKIETVKAQAYNNGTLKTQKAEVKHFVPVISNNGNLLQYFSYGLTSVISLLGAILTFVKFKKDKETEEEVSNELLEPMPVVHQKRPAENYETTIVNIISNFPGVSRIDTFRDSDYGFDIDFEYKGQYYFVEVKYLERSKVGLKSVERFIENLKGMEGTFWFIHNSDLTPLVISRIKRFDKLIDSRRKIEFIQLPNPNLLRERLKNLLAK